MIDLFAPTPYQKIWEDYWRLHKKMYDYLPWDLYDMVKLACEKSFYAGYEIGRNS